MLKKDKLNRYNCLNKKGISSIIGYILLISFVVVISGIVYTWMQSYVPQDLPACPDSVSMIVDASCTGNTLKVTLDNNGLFDISGYYIKGATSADGVATIDLGANNGFIDPDGDPTKDDSYVPEQGFIRFKNLEFGAEDTAKVHTFTLTPGIVAIEVTPMKAELEGSKYRVVSCSKAKVRKAITCS